MKKMDEFENIEKESRRLYLEEMRLGSKSDKIILNLTNKFSICLVTMTLASVFVVVNSSKTVSFPVVVLMALIFLYVFGRSTFNAYNELNNLKPVRTEINKEKERLMNLLTGFDFEQHLDKVDITPSGVALMDFRIWSVINSLRIRTGGFEDGNIRYFMFHCTVSLVYVVSLFAWTGFVSKD